MVLREDLVWAPSIHRQKLSAPNMTRKCHRDRVPQDEGFRERFVGIRQRWPTLKAVFFERNEDPRGLFALVA